MRINSDCTVILAMCKNTGVGKYLRFYKKSALFAGLYRFFLAMYL